jgi:hypothetical protein
MHVFYGITAVWCALHAFVAHAETTAGQTAQTTHLTANEKKPNIQWPRLFYNASERQRVEKERQDQLLHQQTAATVVHPTPLPVPSIPIVTTLELQGIAQTSRGHSAWLNGEVVRTGETYGGWTVHVEAHRMRLNAPEQNEIILRPGQKITLDQGLTHPLDVVPDGSFAIKNSSSALNKSDNSYQKRNSP